MTKQKKSSSLAEEQKLSLKSGEDQKKVFTVCGRGENTKLKAETEKPVTVLVTNLSLLALQLGSWAGPLGL